MARSCPPDVYLLLPSTVLEAFTGHVSARYRLHLPASPALRVPCDWIWQLRCKWNWNVPFLGYALKEGMCSPLLLLSLCKLEGRYGASHLQPPEHAQGTAEPRTGASVSSPQSQPWGLCPERKRFLFCSHNWCSSLTSTVILIYFHHF